MSTPRWSSQPPASAEHVVGQLFEFSPIDDLANPGGATVNLKPVELTPGGTSATRIEFLPTDDRLTSPESRRSDDGGVAPS